MPRTISDQDYDHYQKALVTASAAESIFNDPALGKDAKRLFKKKFPHVPIPDIDMEDELERRLAAERKERESEKAAQAEERRRKQEEKYAADRKKVQDEYSFTDEAMDDLEKQMIERNIGNYEDAAALRAMRNPQTTTPGGESRFWRYQEQDSFNELAKDPEKWMERQLMDAIKKDEAQAKGWR